MQVCLCEVYTYEIHTVRYVRYEPARDMRCTSVEYEVHADDTYVLS